MRTTLGDGTEILIRPIRPDDKERLSAAYAQLSRETIVRRFLTAKPRLTSSDLRYLTEVDGRNHVALVAVLPGDPEAIVAVGRFVRLGDDPETAEFAIVVGDAYQRRGIGTLLAEQLAHEAAARGVRRFAGTALAENVAIHRLLQRIATGLRTEHAGPLDEFEAELPAGGG